MTPETKRPILRPCYEENDKERYTHTCDAAADPSAEWPPHPSVDNIMHPLTYQRLITEDDGDIPTLKAYHQMPEIAQYVSISDNYFHYVTNSENIYFFKVYENNRLIGSTHLEKQGERLCMDIVVFPAYQKCGLGTQILLDIKSCVLGLDYDSIEVSVDPNNTASRRLFEKAGFEVVSNDDELIHLTYQITRS